MTLVDTHCHLADPKFDGDRDAAVARAWDAGLAGLVEIGEREAEWPAARRLAERHPGKIFWTAGLHPYVADAFDDGFPARLRDALRHPQAVAVGEIGLDYYKNCAVPRDVQKRSFAAAAGVAVDAGKPMVLHCREADPLSTEAQEDMLGVLEGLFAGAPPRGVRGVAHCFQGTPAHARRFVALGFFVGVDAPITYPKAEALRAMAAAVPLDSLVLETDAPYLPPADRRGGRNEPAFLPAVCEALARVRGAPAAEVARVTTENARRRYGVPFG